MPAAEVEVINKDKDSKSSSIHTGSIFPFPPFTETLRTMFGLSVGEELYCFTFYFILLGIFIYF